jgi:hypothetical protein
MLRLSRVMWGTRLFVAGRCLSPGQANNGMTGSKSSSCGLQSNMWFAVRLVCCWPECLAHKSEFALNHTWSLEPARALSPPYCNPA